MILNKYKIPVELKLYYYDSTVVSKESFKNALRNKNAHPALLTSMIVQQMRGRFKNKKMSAETIMLNASYKKQITPKWMQTFEEFIDLHDVLTDKTGFLFGKVANKDDFITQNVNIDGKIAKFTVIIDALKPSDIDGDGELIVHSTWVHYRSVYKPFHLSLHRSKDILIPDLKRKVLLRPDEESKDLFLKTSGLDGFTYRYQYSNIKNIIDLMNPKKKLPFNINVVFRQGSPLKYVKIKEMLMKNENKAIVKEMTKAFKRKQSTFKYEDNFYIYSMDEFKHFMDNIFTYLLGDDSIKFMKLLKKAKTIPKEQNFRVLKQLKSTTFNADLYDHQKIGVSWLYMLYELGINGAILGDDMGMGKTIQSIAFLSLINKETLIICPASVVGSWESEINKFNPKLSKQISVMSYEKYIRMKGLHVEVIIFDEAQKMKNANTNMSATGKVAEAKFKLLLTGTPIENTVKDLHTLVGIIMPFSSNSLRSMYTMFDKRSESKIAEITKDLIQGIYIGRKRTSKEVAAKMVQSNEYITPSKDELKIYENIKKVYSKKLGEVGNNNIEYYNEMIIGLTRMRQAVSNIEMLPYELIPNGILVKKPTKLNVLVKKVEYFRKLNEKTVVFAQYTKTIAMIKKELGENKCHVIDGSVPKNLRTKMIAEFQAGDTKDVFIISLKAGGTGITLTAANHVIMYDLWWNPAIEAQAFARVHRIGQVKDVTAERLVMVDSIDDAIMDVLYSKQKVIAAFDGDISSKPTNKDMMNKVAKKLFGL